MKKPLLIHIPKTGGVSLQHNGVLELECFGHNRARDIDNLQDYYSFAVIREPAERLSSAFHFYKHVYEGDRPIRGLVQKYATVDEFCEDYSTSALWNDHQFRPMYEYVMNEDFEVMVDKLLHFDRLQNDFKQVTWLYGRFNINHQLPYLNESPNKNEVSDYVRLFAKTRYALDYYLYLTL